MYRNLLAKITEDDHDSRRGVSTVYAKLLKKGFTDDEINVAIEKSQGTDSRLIHLSSIIQEGGDPVIGIAYTGDYRSEEESGLSTIGKNLAQFDSEKLTEIHDFKDRRVFVVLEDEMSSYRTENSIKEAYRRHTEPLNMISHTTALKTVAELRAALKSIVTPLPKTRRSLEIAFESSILGNKMKSTESIGEFHFGGSLAMMTDEPILLAVLEILFEDTVQTNSLRFGSSSNPFSRDGFFYDVNDLTYAHISELAANEQWYEDRMEEAADAIVALKASGSLWAIRPTHMNSVTHRPDLGEGDYYFINYSPSRAAQVFGWFPLDELFKVASGEITAENLDKQSRKDDLNSKDPWAS